jgi:hypothetical protein
VTTTISQLSWPLEQELSSFKLEAARITDEKDSLATQLGVREQDLVASQLDKAQVIREKDDVAERLAICAQDLSASRPQSCTDHRREGRPR